MHAINYYALTHVRIAMEIVPPKKKQEKGKKDFIWTDDESELLFNVIDDYKVQQLQNHVTIG